MRYSDTKVQLAVSTSRSQFHLNTGPTSLSPSQLVGVFIIWFIGISISSIVFVWERLVKVKKVKVRFSNDFSIK